MANSLAAWLTFDQLSCKFENFKGGAIPPHAPPSAHPCFHHPLSIQPSLVLLSATVQMLLTAIFLFLCARLATQILSLGWMMPSWIKVNKQGEVGCNENVMVYTFSRKNFGEDVYSELESNSTIFLEIGPGRIIILL